MAGVSIGPGTERLDAPAGTNAKTRDGLRSDPPEGRISRRRSQRGWLAAVSAVTGATALGLVLPSLERTYHLHVGLTYGYAAAQDTLMVIAAGMITLTGFVFTALTLLVQTVQSQSPRLLRALDQADRFPLLFGTFIATFSFALVVLAQIRPNAVPNASVTLGVLFVLTSVGLFLRLLVNVRSVLTVGGLTRTIGREVSCRIEALYPEKFCSEATSDFNDEMDSPTWTLHQTGESGFLQSVNLREILALAERFDAEITVLPSVGDYVVAGRAVAVGSGPVSLAEATYRLMKFGPVRTLDQDVEYGIRLLVDIAVRALSKAINDPTSVVQALDQLDDLLHRLVSRSLGQNVMTDSAGRVRVRYLVPTWDAVFSLAIDEIRLYGISSLQVARRLRALLLPLHDVAPKARRPAIQARLDWLERTLPRTYLDPLDLSEASVADRRGIGSNDPAQRFGVNSPTS